MTWRLVLAPAAATDVVELRAYLEGAASPKIADRQIGRILAKIEHAATNPLACPARPKIGAGYRIAPVRPYVVIFRCRDNEVRILRVVHGARDFSALDLGA